eukprot:m.39028 g.39028  ORF g.39028 m.39028 type:complete len:60 (+) comp11228_c0_seq2:2122-2301(+)
MPTNNTHTLQQQQQGRPAASDLDTTHSKAAAVRADNPCSPPTPTRPSPKSQQGEAKNSS